MNCCYFVPHIYHLQIFFHLLILFYFYIFPFCRISELQSRVSSLRTRLYSGVVQPLLSRAYVEEGRTVTRRTEIMTEVRLVDTNPAFRHVQDCLDWIEAQQVNITICIKHLAMYSEQENNLLK